MYVCKANHSVTAFSYLLEEKDKPGRFNVEKAKELGIPEGELWNKLQNGSEITINEKIIKPEQVLGEKRPGKKIGISGDTMPTKELEKFFEECDYLVFDSTFLDEEKQRAQDTCHSTAKQAATLGKNAKVKNLILTHFSARYKDEVGHLKEAGEIHNSVTTARDLLEIEIK
jgi:ribonuclease Z